jgi:exo-1,4-beta-D-glucosaminidase
VQKTFLIPQVNGLSPTYFLRLTLEDSNGKLMSSNFYWLSTKPDTLDWKGSTWYYTPMLSSADFTELHQLPVIDLTMSATSQVHGDSELTRVTLRNPSKSLAFLAHVKVMRTLRGSDEDDEPYRGEVLPVLWSDNYVSLMPGETRELTATYRPDSEKERSAIEVDGWNIKPKSIRTTAQ